MAAHRRGGRNKMKTFFSKKQYRTLVKLIYLGSWLANAHRTVDMTEGADIH